MSTRFHFFPFFLLAVHSTCSMVGYVTAGPRASFYKDHSYHYLTLPHTRFALIVCTHLSSCKWIFDLANVFVIMQINLRSCIWICNLANEFLILQMNLRSCRQRPVIFQTTMIHRWEGKRSNLLHSPWGEEREPQRAMSLIFCKLSFQATMRKNKTPTVMESQK